MREDGFTLKQTLLGKMTDPAAANEVGNIVLCFLHIYIPAIKLLLVLVIK